MFMWGTGLKRWTPWPREMRFTIERYVQHLEMLLFIRRAWMIAQARRCRLAASRGPVGGERTRAATSTGLALRSTGPLLLRWLVRRALRVAGSVSRVWFVGGGGRRKHP